jgi:hypothetical protein
MWVLVTSICGVGEEFIMAKVHVKNFFKKILGDLKMKKILTFIGLILWGGMGDALCGDAGQWKCPASQS